MNRISDAGVITIASVAFFLVGLATAFFLNLEIPLASFNVSPAIDLLLLGLAVMVFSMLFFGRLTPLFFFLVGANQVGLLNTMPLALVLHAVPLFLMGFVGTLFGMSLLDDLNGDDNIYSHKKELLKWFAISVAVSLAIGLLNSQIIEANAALLGTIGVY